MAQRDANFLAQVLAEFEARTPVAPREDPRLRELRRQGWTEDGIDLLLARGSDPLKAAAEYEAEHPPPTAVTSSSGRWEGLVAPPEPDLAADIRPLLASGGRDDRWTREAVKSTLRQMRAVDDVARFDTAFPGFEFVVKG
jgi:hypothetical protein